MWLTDKKNIRKRNEAQCVLGPKKTRGDSSLVKQVVFLATGFSDRIVTILELMIIRLRKRSLLLRRKLLMKFQGLEQTVPSRTRTMIGLLRMNFAAHRSSCCSQSWVHVRVINAHIKSEIAFAQRPDEGFSRLC